MSDSSTPSTTEQPETSEVQPLEAKPTRDYIPWATDLYGNSFILV